MYNKTILKEGRGGLDTKPQTQKGHPNVHSGSLSYQSNRPQKGSELHFHRLRDMFMDAYNQSFTRESHYHYRLCIEKWIGKLLLELTKTEDKRG